MSVIEKTVARKTVFRAKGHAGRYALHGLLILPKSQW